MVHEAHKIQPLPSGLISNNSLSPSFPPSTFLCQAYSCCWHLHLLARARSQACSGGILSGTLSLTSLFKMQLLSLLPLCSHGTGDLPTPYVIRVLLLRTLDDPGLRLTARCGQGLCAFPTAVPQSLAQCMEHTGCTMCFLNGWFVGTS